MKKSIVLVEFIFSIIIFSIVSIYSMKIIVSFYEKNSKTTTRVVSILKLESTKLFLSKNGHLDKIKYQNSKLYYQNNLLLDDVSYFTITQTVNISTINICLSDNTVCQEWKL